MREDEVEWRGRRSATYENYGIRADLSGNAVRLRVSRTQGEQRALMDSYRKWRATADSEYADSAAAILEVLKPYSASAILGHIIFSEGVGDPETYKESLQRGLAAKIEHVALLLLSHEQNGFVDDIPFEVIEQLNEYLEEIFASVLFYYGDGPSEDPDIDKADPKSKILMWELFVRMPSYIAQLRTTLESLFDPIADWMTSSLGFSVRDAIALERAFEELDNVVFTSELRGPLLESFRSLREHVILAEGGGTPKPGQEADAQSSYENMQSQWSASMARIGRGVFHSPRDLAEQAGIKEDVVLAILSRMTVSREALGSAYIIPVPDSPLKHQPCVKLGDYFLLPSPTLFLPALKPDIEHALNPAFGEATADARIWQTYESNRADLLEVRSTAAISKLLNGAVVHRSLKYKSTIGQKSYDELDGLGVLDSKLFLFEGKAGGFGWTPRRGDIDAIEGRIGELVTVAHRQALRALTYVGGKSEAVFQIGVDTLVLNMNEIDEVFLITTTFEQLGHVTSCFADVDRVNATGKGETPWVLSVHDLETCAKYIPNAPTFVHYLKRRVDFNASRAMKGVFDELDWLGRYFYDALSFVEMRHLFDDPEQIVIGGLLSHTAEFDAYELFEEGQRVTPAPWPTPKIHSTIAAVVTALSNSQMPAFLNVSLALLNLVPKQQRSFGKRIGAAVEKAKRLKDLRIEKAVPDDDSSAVFVAICGQRANPESFTIPDLEDRSTACAVIDPQLHVLKVKYAVGKMNKD